MNGFPVHVQFISNHSGLIFVRIEHILSPVLRRHLSVLLMVARCAAFFQQGLCRQKTCASEGLVFLTLHDLQRHAEIFHMLWHSHRA